MSHDTLNWLLTLRNATLQPPHMQIALRSAIGAFAKANNQICNTPAGTET